MTTTIQAYYNGTSFVPVKPLEIPTGKMFQISIQEEKTPPDDLSKKLAELRKITNNLHQLNTTEPLPPEFDEILSQRIHFKENINQ
jgi:hypothetical protein